MTKKNDSRWLGFDWFGSLPYYHQIIDTLLGAYVDIPVPYDLLGVEGILQNCVRSANTIADLLWYAQRIEKSDVFL